MKTSIIFIGTDKYIDFFPSYYHAMKSFFLKETDLIFHVFTNKTDHFNWNTDTKVYHIDHIKWPFITLLRFRFINDVIDEIAQSDNCIFADADLIWQKQTTVDDLFKDKKYFAVQHPGYYDSPGKGTFETNPISVSSVSQSDDLSTYWQGCLWGAKSSEFSYMISKLSDNVEKDLQKNYVAIWHDESHLNRFLIDHKNDVNTLHPGYATPENYENIKQKFPTMAIHIHKPMNIFPRFPGVR